MVWQLHCARDAEANYNAVHISFLFPDFTKFNNLLVTLRIVFNPNATNSHKIAKVTYTMDIGPDL